MNQAQHKRNLKQSLAQMLMAASILAMLTSACTKSRDASIKDEELSNEIFAIADLQGKEFSIETGGEVVENSTLAMTAGEEKVSTKITQTSAPSRLSSIFKGVSVRAGLSKSYPVRMVLDRDAMHVLKVVKDESDLTVIEKQARIVEKDKSSLVPLFNLKVVDYGTLCQVKDDNGDKTTNMNLCHTDFESASHVRLSLIKNDRAGYFKTDEMKEIFLANRINGRVSTLAELKEQLNVSLSPATDDKVLSFVVPSAGSKVEILIYKILKKSDIKDEKLLKKLNSNVKLGEIGFCPDEAKKQLSADDQKDCVIVLSHVLEASAVQAELKTKDDFGNSTMSVDFKSAEANKNLNLIRIGAHSPVQTIDVKEVSQLNPYNTIRVADLRDKEFLLRRTFEDGASGIMVFGPGASAEADIVKFEFEDRRLVVRKATIANGDRNSSSLDREELMSIPVQYFGIDPASNVQNPKLISATKEKAAYVVLDWTNNTLPVLNSPLAYFQNGQCFASVGSQSVTDLDNRIHEGVLSFSISGSYSFRTDCMSWYQLNDYWYGGGLQGTFNLKERVSFKLHTGELDKKAMDLPFRAQSLMSFGVFTAGKINPDDFGNNRNVGTELAHPITHDFSDGKQLVYVLGGLPASGWMREVLIEGTKDVVDEWNKGLHDAFKGTNLERKGPYIVLKIDGVDIEPGRLGDLDRNYIWNFEKNLDSGLLGMSQAAPNPRSGRIEQNNVLMYSGNLLAQIGAYKEMARSQKIYDEMKKKALAAAPQPAATEPTTPVVDPNDPNGGLTIVSGRALLQRLQAIPALKKAMTPVALKSKKSIQQNASQLKKKVRETVSGRAQDLGSSRSKQILDGQISEKSYLEKIVRKAIEMNSTRDESTLNALSAAEILKAYGNRLNPDQKNALAAQVRRLALMAEFQKNFSKGPNCALVARPLVSIGDADPDLLDDSKTPQVFKSWYKSTLLHEIGHSLGLTHNFKGSFDKNNFTFAGEEKNEKSRNYSSIMDYIPDQFLNYQGPGPYDVRALRVAYTGMIEIAENAVEALKAKVKIHNLSPHFKNEITLADFKKLTVGEKGSWWDLDGTFYSKVPLKYYHFCTDIHVGGEPTCNRWDLGTSAQEVAQFYADEYRGLYPVMNTKGRRINMRDMGSYIAKIQYEFFGLRPFLEETYYRAFQGMPYEDTLNAAFEGLNLFAEVVNTPNADLPFDSMSRFQVVQTEVENEDGTKTMKNVLVETKAIQDLMVPGMPDHVSVRGIEIDKVLALMMMTQKGLGIPRYEAMSIRVSYADLEGALGATPEQSATLVTLGSILANNPIGMVQTERGLMALPATLKPTTSELVRYYAGLAAGVFLDADSIEDKYNFAALFRTASSQKSVPEDRAAVAKLDQKLTSPGSVKFWALDNAMISNQMVELTARKRHMIENSQIIMKALLPVFAAKASGKAEELTAARTEAVKILNDLNKTNLVISKEEAAQGITAEVVVDGTVSFMEAQLKTALEVIAYLKKQGIPDDQIPQYASQVTLELATETEAATKQTPIFGIAQKAMLAVFSTEQENATNKMIGAVLATYLNENTLEIDHGIVVNNLQFLNQILNMTHPELSRY